jgi:Fe(3+) dicitrate transport protein
MDRFQATETYDQVTGSLVYQSTTPPTGSDNLIEEADALSFWVADDWQISDRLNSQFVMRYEDVESSRVQYDHTARTVVASTLSNDSSELLPGASLTYDLNDNLQLLTGIHKGFSPLGGGASENESPETSTNWEAGVRYSDDSVHLEAIGFYSDFSNKAENCSLASPCSNGDTSGRFITGAAEIAGIEFLAAKSAEVAGYTIPLQASYTLTKATVSETNGSFNDGDQLKDVPKHVLSLQTGLETAVANHYVIGKFQSDVCVTTGCNRNDDIFDRTESLFTVDAVSHIPVNNNVDFIVKVENIFDRQQIISRSPDGARPNKPATLSLGMNIDF